MREGEEGEGECAHHSQCPQVPNHEVIVDELKVLIQGKRTGIAGME